MNHAVSGHETPPPSGPNFSGDIRTGDFNAMLNQRDDPRALEQVDDCGTSHLPSGAHHHYDGHTYMAPGVQKRSSFVTLVLNLITAIQQRPVVGLLRTAKGRKKVNVEAFV
ncbi:hypothetical protein E2C01_021777 [Portunus trituberculatus]|uniref:Uncharacterized protein n=1 Tax=Portunus trituberculatus TaxID=210409 RepID=A0A5B7E4A9_PORTR|nr:hypothetical protein [Portunus trituberculatus]